MSAFGSALPKQRVAALDGVVVLGIGLATDEAEPLRADRARMLAGDRQQPRGLTGG